MLLLFSDGEAFATSSQPYFSRPLGPGDPSNRLIIDIEVAGLTTPAVVDTGAPYLILDPAFAQVAGIGSTGFSSVDLSIRGHRTIGFLHRLDVVLKADRGKDVVIDSTVFVPEVGPGVWDLPSFVGWTGCLERFRFAVDPVDETFYFGPWP
ncbi:MAG: hypothetical protein ACREDR_12900 [Blastocatellia bacterium]